MVLLAGGLGTRIGSNSPKGMLDIELPSHRSLFQIHAEMLLAQQNAAGAKSIPLYIMTSPVLSATIESAFEILNDHVAGTFELICRFGFFDFVRHVNMRAWLGSSLCAGNSGKHLNEF